MVKTANELGKILKDMYDNAPRNEQVTMIHLFGIQYQKEIQAIGVRETIEAANIHTSYKTELTKAIKLANYVTPIKKRKS